MKYNEFINSSLEHICNINNYNFAAILDVTKDEYKVQHSYNLPSTFNRHNIKKVLFEVTKQDGFKMYDNTVLFVIDNYDFSKRVCLFKSENPITNINNEKILESFQKLLQSMFVGQEVTSSKSQISLDSTQFFDNIIESSAKGIENNGHSILSQILKACMAAIPEADYGSISVVEEDNWKFIDAVGHDINLLKSREYSYYIMNQADYSDDIIIIDDIFQLNRTTLTQEDIESIEVLNKASKPIKQSLIARIIFNNRLLGQISLDIDKKSNKNFTEISKQKIGVYRNLTSIILIFTEYYSTVEKFDKILNLFSGLINSTADNYEGFLRNILDISIKEISEANYGSIGIFNGENYEFISAIGHDIDKLNKIKIKMDEVVKSYSDSENAQKLYDNVYIIKDFISENYKNNSYSLANKIEEASKPIKESLIVNITHNGTLSGMICLDIDKKSNSVFSRKSIRMMKTIGDLCSIYIAYNSSVKLLTNFEQIINSLSKMFDAATNQDEAFLSEILKMTIEQIPEADYGSISEMDEEQWRFIDAIGHDINILKSLPLKRENSIEISELSKDSSESLVHMERVDDYSKYNKKKMDEGVSEAFIKATMPVKNAILMQYLFKGMYGGNFSVEIAKDSKKDFSEQSIRLLKAIGNIVFIFLGFKKYADEQVKAKNEIELWNRQLEKRVDEKTKSIKNLLDNTGQGFLCFDKDLIVDPEYSRECKLIFGMDISNKNVLDILFKEKDMVAETFEKSISMIQSTNDDFMKNMLLELLPKELILNLKILKISYRMLQDSKTMMIISDITHEKRLEEKIKEEQQRLKMIVACVNNRNDVLDVVKMFNEFSEKGIYEIINSGIDSIKKLREIYRGIHTFKGLFSQMYFIDMPKKLHELETELSFLIKAGDCEDFKVINCFSKYKLDVVLESDLKIIKSIFNEEFASKKRKIFIDEEKVRFLEGFADKISSNSFDMSDSEKSRAVEIIKTLRHVSLKKLLDSYPEFSYQLAETLGKAIQTFYIEGDDLNVDPDIYLPFTKSLIHVFRNAIDHGIESPDERIEAGKDETAKIACRIENNHNQIILTIADDGRGIDIETIKEKAIEKGLVDERTCLRLGQSEILNLIFSDELTTRKDVSELSGRGIGLSAVMKELMKLGGTVEIKTIKGMGTEFIFKL